MASRRPTNPHNPMADAFLRGLRKRGERDLTGQVTLPIGKVDVADVDRVLQALDRARDEEGGRR